MKDKKGLIIIICILAAIIIGLVIYIIAGRNKDKASQEVTTESATEATTEAATEEEQTTRTDAAEEEQSDKLACYVTISAENNWQDGDSYVYQFTMDIHNDSNEAIEDWEVQVSGFEGGDMGDNWNGEYKISGDTLTATAVDYNETVEAKSSINMGFQVRFDTTDHADADKTPVLYVGGEKYATVKEEPATESKEEKEASKKEKRTPETGTPLDNHGALSIDGTDIVDQSGDKYQLRGISTHGLAWFPEYVNRDAFQTLRDDWGANLIRLAMYTDESGGYCSDGDKSKLKQLVEDGVEYATDLGMYVIIDWHILHDNNPVTNQDEAIAFFDEMSAKYSDYDNVLYEICNEPNGSTSWSDIKGYAEAVIPVIRANDSNAIIIVGTPTWSQDVDLAADDPITGEKNIAYTTHFYAATHKENIRNKVKTAHDKGLCVFISEFSICDASGNGGIDYDSADDWFELIDEYNLSYAGWNLSNKDETSSLISSSCKSVSGWSDDDLSETGKWLKDKISGD